MIRSSKAMVQRKGFKPGAEVIQTDSMNSELRNSLWNVLDIKVWSDGRFEIYAFSETLWFLFFKKPIDSRPDQPRLILKEIRDRFFSFAWYEVYDFLEFVVGGYQKSKPQLVKLLNATLERELSGYRFVSGRLTDITNPQELEMLETALTDSQFVGVDAHLQQALALYAKRDDPDYRNSIKESISAVESMAKIISGNPKAELSDALKEMKKKKLLHAALKEGFIKLYGYTSDADGIRHSMMDKPNLDAADSRYFLLSCTSFINYLKAQIEP